MWFQKAVKSDILEIREKGEGMTPLLRPLRPVYPLFHACCTSRLAAVLQWSCSGVAAVLLPFLYGFNQFLA
jgi:hypothetical protein